LSRKVLQLAIAFSLFPAPSVAEERQDVELFLRAPPECGDGEALGSQIEGRSSRLRVSSGEATNRAEVNVEKGPPYVARVVVTRAGTTTERELEAKNCGELMDAVALIVVVTLDPLGTTTEEPELDPNPEVIPNSSPTTEATAEATAPAATTSEPPAGRSTTTPPASPPEWRDDIAPPDFDSPIKFSSFVPDRWGVRSAARGHHGPAPRFMLGPELGIELEWNPRDVVSTKLALSVSRTWSGGSREIGGVAAFTLDRIALELCPLRLGGQRWDVRPCIDGAAGRFSSSGSDTISPRSAARPWSTLGASARLSGRPLEWLEPWGSAGIAAALVRDRFQFDDGDDATPAFHWVPAEILSFAVGVTVRFP
jgi:hypothetical protein